MRPGDSVAYVPLIDLRRDELPKLFYLALLAFLAVGEAVLIRTLSDALFLDRFDVDRLALFYLASAAAFVPATLVYGWLRRAFHARYLHGAMLLVFSLGSLASYLMPGTDLSVFMVLLGLAVVSPLANVVAWSSIQDRLNAREARRFVPLTAAGATLGGVVAGVLAIPYIKMVGVVELLLPIALINLVLAFLVVTGFRSLASLVRTGTLIDPVKTPMPTKSKRRTGPGLSDVLANPLLRVLAVSVLLMSMCTNLVDYAFKAKLQSTFDSGQATPDEQDDAADPALAQAKDQGLGAGTGGGITGMGLYLSSFNAFTNLLILLFQVFLVSKLVRKLGLQTAFAIHPAAMLLGLGLFVAIPGLWMVAGWKLLDILLKFTFHGPTLDMALTPVERTLRDRGRAVIKGVMHPFGGVLAGLGLLAADFAGGGAHLAVVPGVAIAGAAWLLVTTRLRRHYLDELRRLLSDPDYAPDTASSRYEFRASTGEETIPAEDEFTRSRTDLIRAVDGQVHNLRLLKAKSRAGELDSEVLRKALDRLFELLGSIGDPETVDLVRRRYQYGSMKTKAIALELLEYHLDERRLAEAVALLESLAPSLVDSQSRHFLKIDR